MDLTELLYSIAPRDALAIVIGFSIVFYTLAANLAQAPVSTRPGRIGNILRWARTAWTARALGEIARWVYYLGLPYVTLLLGYNTARALGVWYLNWIDPIPAAVAITIGSILVLVWIWRPYARTEHPHAVDTSRWNWARHIVELIYQQAHWAFYRSGPILWLSGDVYLGSLFGLLLTLVEGWSNPAVRSNVHDTTRADAPLWTGSLAIVSTLLFIYTQNFWYCLILHLLLDLGLRPVIGFPHVALDEETMAHLASTEPIEQYAPEES